MAISNLQETLLMYAKHKSLITDRLNNVEVTLLEATKSQMALQQDLNNKYQSYYFDYSEGVYSEEEYNALCEQLEKEFEYKLAAVNSWDQELELQKDNYETRYNEITATENGFKALLKQNIKNDFTYGVQQ